MDELRRLSYLQAMGVESYFPRFLLGGSRPSVQCEQPPQIRVVAQPSSVQIEAPPTAQPSAAPKGKLKEIASDLADMLDTLPSRSAVPVAKKAAKAADADIAPRTETGAACEPFNIRITGGSDVLALDSAIDAVDDRSTQRFILQLMFAIKAPAEGGLRCSRFAWPIADHPQLDQSEDAAKEALKASVAANLERNGVRLLLVFGELPVRLLDGGQWGETRQLNLPTLDRLLGDAAQKKAVWNALQQLRETGE